MGRINPAGIYKKKKKAVNLSLAGKKCKVNYYF